MNSGKGYSSDYYVNLATKLLENGEYEKGGDLFRKIVSQDKHNKDALFGLGVYHGLLGDEDKSIVFIKEAAKFGSVEAMNFLNGGDIVSGEKTSKRFVILVVACFIVFCIVMIVLKKERILGQFIGGLIGVGIGSFAGALLLQYATLFMAKVKPRYWITYKANVVSLFFSFVLNFNLGFLMGFLNVKHNIASVIFVLFSGFVIDVVVYRHYIKDKNNADLSCGKLSVISLLQIFVGFLLFVLVVLLVTACAVMLRR